MSFSTIVILFCLKIENKKAKQNDLTDLNELIQNTR